jgi:hypothetical protein
MIARPNVHSPSTVTLNLASNLNLRRSHLWLAPCTLLHFIRRIIVSYQQSCSVLIHAAISAMQADLNLLDETSAGGFVPGNDLDYFSISEGIISLSLSKYQFISPKCHVRVCVKKIFVHDWLCIYLLRASVLCHFTSSTLAVCPDEKIDSFNQWLLCPRVNSN